jgi:hypothetical protein
VGGDGLTAAQRRFLAVFVAGSPERRRVVWTREGQVIAPASDLENPPPSATGLRAYRLSDGGYTFVGAAEGRCSLPLREVAGLAPFWRVPLVELNSEGIAAAIPPAVDRQLDVRARAEGLTASDVLRELVDKYLRGET